MDSARDARKYVSYVLSVVVFVIGIFAWQVIVDAFHIPVYLLPGPLRVFSVMVSTSISWPSAILATLYETLAGFALSVVVGLVLAIVIAEFSTLRNIVYPYILVAQIIPKVAIAPILVIWLGFGLESKILLAFLVSFFPIVIDASSGLLLVDDDLSLLFRALGANKRKYLLKLQLPNSVPYLFNGMKVAISLAVIGAVVAEFISAKNGLGFLILEAQTVTNTTLAFASIVYLSVLGIMLFLAVIGFEALVHRWKPGVKG